MGVVPPATRRILADEIVEAIRDAIVSGQLKFGERLPESTLANSLRVSRGPVREALARLSQEGIVQIERHRGASVTRLGVDEVDEIYSLRQALECLATQWLCRNATAEDFERISARTSSMRSATRIRCRSRTSPASMLRSTTLSSKRLIMNGFTRRGFPCVLKFYCYSLAMESLVNTRLSRGGRTTRTCSKYLSVLNRQRL